jgi:GntR family transcriptional regulator, transcriptional repressor for pyruvate dehydrogenase complex
MNTPGPLTASTGGVQWPATLTARYPVGVSTGWSIAALPDGPGAVRTHERVIALIEQQILDGKLHPGDRLPAERDLAKLLGISRQAVREALRILDFLGVISSQVGRGPESGSVLTTQPTPALTSFLRLHMALSHFERHELIETRIQLEALAASRAAARATADDLADLTALLSSMDDSSMSPARFHAADTQFHVQLAQASGDRLLGTLMDAIRDVVQHEMAVARGDDQSWPRTACRLRSEHKQILAAVRDGDSAAAASRVEEHIRRFYA